MAMVLVGRSVPSVAQVGDDQSEDEVYEPARRVVDLNIGGIAAR